MKKIIALVLVALLINPGCSKFYYDEDVKPYHHGFVYNEKHPLIDSIQSIVNKNISNGIPGIQVIVNDKNGWCQVTGGLSKIEQNRAMKVDMISWLYSITKIYTATLTLIAAEKHLLELDTKIQTYLPADIYSHIPSSDKITIRMLLNHTSGIKNFTTTSAYQLAELNTPLDQPGLLDQMKFIFDKNLLFSPGSDFFYSNTNYGLLQLILEQAYNKPYNEILTAEIINPLQLSSTYYGLSNDQVLNIGTPNFYFERYNNGQLENVTRWNNAIGQSLEGYGGILAHGTDVIRFFSALLNGNIVSNESLHEMRSWVTGKGHAEPDYGLGLEYYEYIKGVATYGHEGDNLGGTTQILYIPSADRYIFISINAGRQILGDYLFKTSGAKIDLCRFASKN